MKPCIIFDIDGTLANCSHRVHHVNGSKKNWPAFMDGIPRDTPHAQVILMNELIAQHSNFDIILCSGRSEDERKTTEEWLLRYGVLYNKMFMRASKDYRADHIIKRELLGQIREEGWEPFLVFDDRQCVVDMWRSEGLFVLQCDPKQSHTDHNDYKFHESIKWPLTILVGPSGAGKSAWVMSNLTTGSYEGLQTVVSSDTIRHQLCGDFRDQSQNDKVFNVMHDIARTRLKAGLPVVLDATHIKNADRIKAARLVPEDVPVRYVVINRPLEEKLKTGGWRNAVSVKGKTLIEHHDQVFRSNRKASMKGDGLPNVTVEDLRVSGTIKETA
jgi:predicted kinase